MRLLVKIESQEIITPNRTTIEPIFGNAIYLRYKRLYQMYKYNYREYRKWAIKTARWSFILFPINLYAIYRIKQLIKRIEEDEL